MFSAKEVLAFLFVLGVGIHKIQCEEDLVDYKLFTRTNPTIGVKFNNNNLTFVNFSRPTKIIIHGWLSDTNTWVINMTKAFLIEENFNVIAVNWSRLASDNYAASVVHTKKVGAAVGEVILKLSKNDTNLFESIHLIGHSLGAHVAGIAGYLLADQLKAKLGRISGLDAAAPLYEVLTVLVGPESERLSEGDAKFVDVIHTNCGENGICAPYGTVDYRVNEGGPVQPGCGLVGYGKFSGE